LTRGFRFYVQVKSTFIRIARSARMLARSDSPLLPGDGTRGTAKSHVSSARAESRGKSRKVWRDRSANFISSHAAKYARSTRNPSHDIPKWASAASPTHVYLYKTRRKGNEIPIRARLLRPLALTLAPFRNYQSPDTSRGDDPFVLPPLLERLSRDRIHLPMESREILPHKSEIASPL
jgi:hypothetical protein